MEVVARHGLPEQIITDNGSHFVNQLMREVAIRLRIKHTTTTPQHPQGNGMIERFNRTLKDRMRPYLNKLQTNWDRVIPLVLYAYRTTEHESTGFTPFKMLTGREAVHPGSTARLVGMNETAARAIDPHDAVMIIIEGIQGIHEKARINMDRAKQRVAAREGDLPPPREFKPGDRVRIYNNQVPKGLSKKLSSPWRTVGIVESQTGPVTYKVRPCGTSTAKSTNVDRLKAATSAFDEDANADDTMEVPDGRLRRDRRQTVFNQDAFLTPDQEDSLKKFAVGEDHVPTARTQSERLAARKLNNDVFDPVATDPSLKDIQPDDRFEHVEKHEVEAVIGRRNHEGKVQYKCKWRWWPRSSATWEDEDNLTCDELVQDYENRVSDAVDLEQDDLLFPSLNDVIRIRHCKELNREHTVKVVQLDEDGITLEYLAEPTRKKGSKKESLVGRSPSVSLKHFLQFYQWEKEMDEAGCAFDRDLEYREEKEDAP
ncbi:unnamed protein product [Vitrella brassicaformis CCMP3155]|uniref:Integrase catalytic domain-containing protein n=1 Tax=Vitrella brassicaformis (strain CCMP3155) TaxID=1169540 RepID=A0A0G4ELT4_VITBC|nr:unnamed protein product [Vitrella brassicaformis CCMP3155]|eukprot:CEL97793.1 unnamed protein product [Vitrella brassicaformis CCMP3155]